MAEKLSLSFRSDYEYIDIGGANDTTGYFTIDEKFQSNTSETTQKRSYKNLWQKAKSKIVASLRMQKVLNDINLLGVRGINERNLSDEKLVNYLSSKTSKLFDPSKKEAANDVPHLIFHPYGCFMSAWNLSMVLVLLYTAIVTPFLIGFIDFGVMSLFYIIDMILDCFYFMDFWFACNTAYYNTENQLVWKRWRIFTHYLKGWFCLDMISAIPFTFIDYSISTGTQNSTDKLAELSRLRNLPKLIKLTRVFKLAKSFQDLDSLDILLGITQRVKRIIAEIMIILFALHIVSCIWHMTAKADDFGPGTWVYRYLYQDFSIWQRYLASVYWGLTTLATVGYGDISPYTTNEKILAMIWMCFSVYFISFAINSLSSMLSQIESREKIVEDRLTCVDDFLKVVSLSNEIKHKMRRTIKNSSDISTFTNKDRKALFDTLPVKIKLDIAINMFDGAVKKFSFFSYKDEAFLSNIAVFLEYSAFKSGISLWSEGENSNGIYFIISGRVNYVYVREEIPPFRTFTDGQYFGDLEVIKDEKRIFSASTTTVCQFLVLPKNIVWKICTEFPAIWKDIVEVAEQREEKMISQIAEMLLIKEFNSMGKIREVKGKDIKAKISQVHEKIREEIRPNSNQKLSKLMDLEKKIEINTQAIIKVERTLENVVAVLERIASNPELISRNN